MLVTFFFDFPFPFKNNQTNKQKQTVRCLRGMMGNRDTQESCNLDTKSNVLVHMK